MNKLVFRDELYLKVIKLSQHIWEHRVKEQHVESWLNNFQESDEIASCEQLHALYLLSNFMFFGVREIREMLKSAFRDQVKNPLVQEVRRGLNGTKDEYQIERVYKTELMDTRFLGIGNPSESGTHLLYFFRQENELPKELFMHSHEIIEVTRAKKISFILRNQDIKRYVFLDDVCGSGQQAVEYSSMLIEDMKALNNEIEIQYISLFATSDGLQNIKNNTAFDKVSCVFELDDTYKCFSQNSRYFPGNLKLPVTKKFSEEIARKYGNVLVLNPNDCLGYENGQLLIGFSHNTPDNTLPIIWCSDQNWFPVFKRYAKLSSSFYD